jgi:hypothetical protein
MGHPAAQGPRQSAPVGCHTHVTGSALIHIRVTEEALVYDVAHEFLKRWKKIDLAQSPMGAVTQRNR